MHQRSRSLRSGVTRVAAAASRTIRSKSKNSTPVTARPPPRPIPPPLLAGLQVHVESEFALENLRIEWSEAVAKDVVTQKHLPEVCCTTSSAGAVHHEQQHQSAEGAGATKTTSSSRWGLKSLRDARVRRSRSTSSLLLGGSDPITPGNPDSSSAQGKNPTGLFSSQKPRLSGKIYLDGFDGIDFSVGCTSGIAGFAATSADGGGGSSSSADKTKTNYVGEGSKTKHTAISPPFWDWQDPLAEKPTEGGKTAELILSRCAPAEAQHLFAQQRGVPGVLGVGGIPVLGGGHVVVESVAPGGTIPPDGSGGPDPSGGIVGPTGSTPLSCFLLAIYGAGPKAR